MNYKYLCFITVQYQIQPQFNNGFAKVCGRFFLGELKAELSIEVQGCVQLVFSPEVNSLIMTRFGEIYSLLHQFVSQAKPSVVRLDIEIAELGFVVFPVHQQYAAYNLCVSLAYPQFVQLRVVLLAKLPDACTDVCVERYAIIVFSAV